MEMDKTTRKMAAARSFVRSLNILLKYARLYGFDHARTTEQFNTAWDELRGGLNTTPGPVHKEDGGVLLGATGSQLLLDGAPLEGAGSERSFAQLLSSAGLASIQFLPSIKRDEFERFVRAFPVGNAKASALADQLKAALSGMTGIRINEVRFVAEDASTAEFRMAATLTAKTLGPDAKQFREWMSDPQKLLQLIAAAEGSRAGGGGSGPVGSGQGGGQGGGWPGGSGSGSGSSGGPGGGQGGGWGSGPGNGGGSGSGSGGWGSGSGSGSGGSESGGPAEGWNPRDEEIMNMFRLVSRIGQMGVGTEAAATPEGAGTIQAEIEKAPVNSRKILEQALATLARQAPATQSDEPMLLRLAEHLAIRFALERYERGEVRVNAVREMIDKMGQEISALRKVLGSHEDRMAQAGIIVEAQEDLLDRQFWAAVPEAGKRSVLTSPDAYCVPPRNIRQFVQELIARGDPQTAHTILDHYSASVNHEDANARRRAAIGLSDLADLYSAGEGPMLEPAIRRAGIQLAGERDTELQTLIGAAFVRLAQEAAIRRNFRAMLASLECLESIEHQRPTFAQSMRPRLGLDQRVPEFVGEAMKASPQYPQGLLEVLGGVSHSAAQDLVKRFNRCSQAVERECVVHVAAAIGPQITAHLRETLQQGQPNEAADVTGLLVRLDTPALKSLLTSRLVDWPQMAQDRALRLVAGSGGSERGRLLLGIFDQFDSMLQPLALDEIGMSREVDALELLLHLASGAVNKPSAFLRLKAVEALGRLRAVQAAELLREIVEAKKMWKWQYPGELRLAAFLALRGIAPAWANEFFPRSGFTEDDINLGPRDAVPEQMWFRQRRHLRVRLKTILPSTATSEHETIALQVRSLSLSGGLASGERHIPPGTLVTLRLGNGLRPIRAQAFMRGARSQALSFEFAEMDLEDRARLRRLLHENSPMRTGVPETNPGPVPAEATKV